MDSDIGFLFAFIRNFSFKTQTSNLISKLLFDDRMLKNNSKYDKKNIISIF